jgi:hypothetical protein
MKDVNFSSYTSVNNVLAICGSSSINTLHEDCVDEDNSGVEKEGDKNVLEAIMSFHAVHTAYKSVKSLFYVCSTDRHNKQNILNLQLVSIHLKHTVSN